PVRRAPRDRPGLGRESEVLPRLRHELRRAPRGLRRQARDPAHPGLGRFASHRPSALPRGRDGEPRPTGTRPAPVAGDVLLRRGRSRRRRRGRAHALTHPPASAGPPGRGPPPRAAAAQRHPPLPTSRHTRPDHPGLDRRLWQATFSSGGAGAAGAAGDGLMLSRTQPRPQDDPGAALDEVQLPVIDTYLSQLPDDVAPRILASRTAVVADAADLPRLREITEPALRNEADRLVGYDTSSL